MNKLKTYITISVLFSLFSCSKILEQEPKGQTFENAFWKTEADAKKALSGAYSSLRSNLLEHQYWHWVGDIVMGTEQVTVNYNNDPYYGGTGSYQGGNFAAVYADDMRDWTRFYQTILQTNLILEKVPAIPDATFATDAVATKRRIRGEALFIRSLVYFQLVRTLGGVPLVTAVDPNPIENKPVARNTATEVLERVISDLDSSISYLDWTYAGSLGVVANKGAAMALQAHANLWLGCVVKSPTMAGTPDMAYVNKASDLVDRIISSSQYGLKEVNSAGVIDSLAYSRAFVGNTRESIFELAASFSNNEAYNNQPTMMFLKDPFIARRTTTTLSVPDGYIATYFPATITTATGSAVNTDIRRSLFFYNINNATSRVFVKYKNIIYNNLSQQSDPYMSNNISIMRYADIQLLRAEIAAYKGNLPGALQYLNDFKKSRNEPITAIAATNYNTVMDRIMDERQKEFYIEGTLYYDNVRMKRGKVSWLTADRYNQEGYLLPLDPKLFIYNKLLVQNKYWQGKI
jgi:hypothetical protein